jgi:hypothetical protein
MSATEDRTFTEVADMLAEWQSIERATAKANRPPLSNATQTALWFAKKAVEEAGAGASPGTKVYDALARFARQAFDEGHDATSAIERGVKPGQRYEVEAAMHHASGKASEAMDTLFALIRSATAIKFTEPREFARLMKQIRHATFRYADAKARASHMYQCLYYPGDPLRWHDYDQDKEEAEYRRQRKAAEKEARG